MRITSLFIFLPLFARSRTNCGQQTRILSLYILERREEGHIGSGGKERMHGYSSRGISVVCRMMKDEEENDTHDPFHFAPHPNKS